LRGTLTCLSQKGNIAHGIRGRADFDPNNHSMLSVGRQICPLSERKSQVFSKKSDLLAVRLAGSILPSSHRSSGNSHFLRKLPKCKAPLKAFNLDQVAKRLYVRGQRLTRASVGGNMTAGHTNCPMCNTQQEYSPPGEGNASAVFGRPHDGLAKSDVSNSKTIMRAF
jgi:hypothetical protein